MEKNTIAKIINFSELSRIITGGDRNALRPKKIPLKWIPLLDQFFLSDLPGQWIKFRDNLLMEDWNRSAQKNLNNK